MIFLGLMCRVVAQTICDNFWFNVIWHMQSVAALIFCRRLAGSDITITPSVMCMNWLCWWYNHAAHVVPPATALAFVSKMNEKRKSTSSSTILVKNSWNTISNEEELEVTSWHEEGEQIIDICHNVRLPQRSTCTIHDNADRITESAKSGTKVFV